MKHLSFSSKRAAFVALPLVMASAFSGYCPSVEVQRLEPPARCVVQSSRELVGPGIMDFEFPATKYAPAQLSEFKKTYSDFVRGTVNTLHGEGYNDPKNVDELLKFCEAVGSILWSNFNYKDTDLLIDGLARKKVGELGTLDCDTSSFVFADILNQFNVNSRLVSLPRHTLLHVETAAGSVCIETTNISCHDLYYHSSDGFNRRYPISYGECDFQIQNCITYGNRANAKRRIGDLPGAIEDLEKAIKLDPKNAYFYTARGAVKERLGDIIGAIEGLNEAIKLDPKFAAAYVFLGIIWTNELGGFKGAIKYYSEAIKLDPKNANAYRNRAVAKERLGNIKGAKSDYDMEKQLEAAERR